MATKLENLPLELAHFENFKKYIPDADWWDYHTVEAMLKRGLVQVSTAFEEAIATAGGFTVVSMDTHDISDGSDGKLSSVRTSSRGTNYSAPVTNIYGKTGTLRVQLYERKQDKFYYFSIPRSAYSHIPSTSNIEIPFELDGTPRRVNRCRINWWDYEMATFKEMACKQYP